MFPKPTRTKNRDLLDWIRLQRCLVCQKTPCDPDHITSRGAGGDDRASNVWPLCHTHHVERHKIGLCQLISKYPRLKLWLQENDRVDVLEKCRSRTTPGQCTAGCQQT